MLLFTQNSDFSSHLRLSFLLYHHLFTVCSLYHLETNPTSTSLSPQSLSIIHRKALCAVVQNSGGDVIVAASVALDSCDRRKRCLFTVGVAKNYSWQPRTGHDWYLYGEKKILVDCFLCLKTWKSLRMQPEWKLKEKLWSPNNHVNISLV